MQAQCHSDKVMEDESMVIVHMDYCFIFANDGEESGPATLVMYDDSTGAIWGLVVRKKGLDMVTLK